MAHRGVGIVVAMALAACGGGGGAGGAGGGKVEPPADAWYDVKGDVVSSTCKDIKRVVQFVPAHHATAFHGVAKGDRLVLEEPATTDVVYVRGSDGYTLGGKREEHAFAIGAAKFMPAKIPVEVAAVLRFVDAATFEELTTVTLGACAGDKCATPPEHANDLIRVGPPCKAVFKRTGKVRAR